MQYRNAVAAASAAAGPACGDKQNICLPGQLTDLVTCPHREDRGTSNLYLPTMSVVNQVKSTILLRIDSGAQAEQASICKQMQVLKQLFMVVEARMGGGKSGTLLSRPEKPIIYSA